MTTVVSRRRLLQAGAAFAAATLVGMGSSAPAQAARAAASLAPTAKVMTLPTRYGTPTDLARTSRKTAWTRDHTGTVLQYDKAAQFWRPVAGHAWRAVLTYGSVVLARWGRPSGANALVMVFGTAPRPHPQPPPPSTPTPRPPLPTPPLPRPAIPTPARAPGAELAATGLNAGALTIGGLGALAVGGLLTARNRRG